MQLFVAQFDNNNKILIVDSEIHFKDCFTLDLNLILK